MARADGAGAAYRGLVPIPLAVGRWNRVGFNRLSTPVARHLPGFAVVHHHGRRSGRAYRTPVNVFPVSGGFVIALAYGPRTDWVRNVVAAGGCTLETRGRMVACGDPRVYRDAGRQGIRPVERAALRAMRVEEFLSLSTLESLAAGP
jgi:deazaflavin-dependent oxidoreductase (nitroreductase family)